MIVIYNLKGALIAVGGMFAGILLFAVTSSLTLGVLTIVAIWCYFGRSGVDEQTGEKKVAGHVFFIPVVYWGILFGVLGLPIGALYDMTSGTRSSIDRDADTGELTAQGKLKQQFEMDERGLKTNESDDPEMSAAVSELISTAFPDSEKDIRVKSSADSVLILIQMPDLKRIKNEDRTTLLKLVQVVAENLRPGVKVYAGLKGRLVYGAIAVPGAEIKTGKVELETPLYAFYEIEPEADETPEEADSGDPGAAPTDSGENAPEVSNEVEQ